MKGLKIAGVIGGALLLTTLGIQASDTLSGTGGSMLAQLAGSTEELCPKGMLIVPTGGTFSCVDQYEASASDDCPLATVTSVQQTQQNINDSDCASVSQSAASPWTYTTRDQAELLCRRSGKRLPTSAEWYHVAIGTPDQPETCNTNGSGLTQTGAYPECRSALDAFDFVGNAWEWTSDDVFDGMYEDRPLPAEGYVTQVASDGVATLTSDSKESFSDDYFWSQSSGVYGMLRGGYYGSKSDAGVYAIQAKTAPTAATVAIGFRCVI